MGRVVTTNQLPIRARLVARWHAWRHHGEQLPRFRTPSGQTWWGTE